MWSYNRHENHEMALAEKFDLPSCYVNPNSVDAWRHRRMLESVLPLINQYPDSTWITVGDGRFGSDAFFLQERGMDVVATSISPSTLEVAYSRGYIRKFAAENAEALRFADDSVDFVLCKESLHHFPRPALGFYEMLRVARKGIVLIEPMEGSQKPLNSLKTLVKRILRHGASDQFEASGNFIYRMTIREATKMLIALGHPCIAFKGINDFWYQPFAAADFDKPSLEVIGTRLGIGVQDVLARLKLLNYGLGAMICFKEAPAPCLTSRLRNFGFSVADLPKNPYRDVTEPVKTPLDPASEPSPIR